MRQSLHGLQSVSQRYRNATRRGRRCSQVGGCKSEGGGVAAAAPAAPAAAGQQMQRQQQHKRQQGSRCSGGRKRRQQHCRTAERNIQTQHINLPARMLPKPSPAAGGQDPPCNQPCNTSRRGTVGEARCGCSKLSQLQTESADQPAAKRLAASPTSSVQRILASCLSWPCLWALPTGSLPKLGTQL